MSSTQRRFDDAKKSQRNFDDAKKFQRNFDDAKKCTCCTVPSETTAFPLKNLKAMPAIVLASWELGLNGNELEEEGLAKFFVTTPGNRSDFSFQVGDRIEPNALRTPSFPSKIQKALSSSSGFFALSSLANGEPSNFFGSEELLSTKSCHQVQYAVYLLFRLQNFQASVSTEMFYRSCLSQKRFFSHFGWRPIEQVPGAFDCDSHQVLTNGEMIAIYLECLNFFLTSFENSST
jgi:hypothetical protein